LIFVNSRGTAVCNALPMSQHMSFIVRYVAEGAPVTEHYQSAMGAIGRVGALVSHGVGSDYAILAGERVLMDQAAIFESLKLTCH